MFMSMSEDGGHLMKGLMRMRLKHFHLCLTFMHKLFIVFENDEVNVKLRQREIKMYLYGII